MSSRVVSVVAACLLYLGGALLAYRHESRAAPDQAAGLGLIYLPSLAQARVLAVGFDTAVADYYWVKALQYFTTPENAGQAFKNLPDYLELVIGLDPDFWYAYKFGGVAVPYEIEPFHMRNTRRSTAILEAGVARFPDDWQLRLFLGYNYLNFHNRPLDAAAQFSAAAPLPGAPPYLSAFSARLFSLGGSLDRAFEFTREVLESTEDLEIRQMMERRLRDLEAEREALRIEGAVAAFVEREGRRPSGIEELVTAELLSPAPTGSFRYDPETDTVSAFGAKRMNRVHHNNHNPDFIVID